MPRSVQEWVTIKLPRPMISLAESVVQRSDEAYKNVPDLLNDLIREKHRELQADTVKNPILSPTGKGLFSNPDAQTALPSFNSDDSAQRAEASE